MTETNDGWVRHAESLEALSLDGGLLTKASPNSTVRHPGWFNRRQEPSRQRLRLHQQILKHHRDRYSAVKQQSRAIVMAGPPGVGKSHARHPAMETAGSVKEDWLVVDADEFKEDLIEASIYDGSYESHVEPAELRDRCRIGERFYPRELAALVHSESAMLARTALSKALRRQDNVVIDGTLKDAREAQLLFKELGERGYEIRVVAVEAAREVASERALSRWKRKYLAAEALMHGDLNPQWAEAYRNFGNDAWGGRWVPRSVLESLYSAGDAPMSVCCAVAHDLSVSHPAVRDFKHLLVSSVSPEPQLIGHGQRAADGELRMLRLE